MKKNEWRKVEKLIYLPGRKPVLLKVPPFRYLTVKGEGCPVNPFFSDFIEVLYPLSWGVKMTLKKMGNIPQGYVGFTEYPLEGGLCSGDPCGTL